MNEEAPGFELDICPLFRPSDIEGMSFALDLSDYDEVFDHAEDVHERVADGTMRCDASWSSEHVELFLAWIDASFKP